MNTLNNKRAKIFTFARSFCVTNIFRQTIAGFLSLFLAISPAAAIQEIGSDDFRISTTSDDGDAAYGAESAKIAYNSRENEYLVVWVADDDDTGIAASAHEVYGQRIDAATGQLVGSRFRISDAGDDNADIGFDVSSPDVAYNPDDNQYLVVWRTNDDEFNAANEVEVVGRLVNANGDLDESGDFLISSMNDDGSSSFIVNSGPAVAYSTESDLYCVVWAGDDLNTFGLLNNEFEVFAEFVQADGTVNMAVDEIRVSDMGGTGDATYQAFDPDVTYNSTTDQFLVVWRADDDDPSVGNGKNEIFGQLLNTDRSEATPNDFQISFMGSPAGDTLYQADTPAVTFNSVENEYYVVWRADDNTGLNENSDFQIFARLIDGSNGSLLGSQHKVSDMGLPGDSNGSADLNPDVIYNPTLNEYLVTWHGDDFPGELSNGEEEVFAQRVDADGANIDGNQRVSVMGPEGSTVFGAFDSVVAFGSGSNNYLVVWSGDTNLGTLVNNEIEIFGQLLFVPTPFAGESGIVYAPNPLRLGQGDTTMTFSDLSPGSELKIYDGLGALVKTLSIDANGTASWSGDNNAGQLVASGVYIIVHNGSSARVAVER